MLLIQLASLLAAVVATTVPPPLCPKAPPHAQFTDSNYRISVAGDPDLFLPGELYTVSLQGVDSGQGPNPFIGFMIWIEIEDGADSNMVNHSLGVFQSHDAQAKIRDQCKPSADNTTAHPKTEVQVIWNAPITAVDICVRLCAKASPVDSNATASVLAHKLCAAPAAPPSFYKQPPIVEPCCACDEAKYEVTFESLWSRNTHPRDFPPESARAHFGDVIGASHTAQFRVWQEGRVASSGMRRLAEDGATTSLEKELKAESDHIRTIIKARGITWRQVAGEAGVPSTFAVFRVDPRHHLVSLAAKLAPSPDWIVGVSALELCNPNCTWSKSATLSLFPYDAGTDSGLSYTASRLPTIPSSPVRALRPDWPRDVRSPFFSTTGEMRPFARLRLNRLRLYEKSCDISGNRTAGSEIKGELFGGICATYSWKPWGPCSVTCGEGRQSRQRYYIWPARAHAESCRVSLTDYQRCYGPRRHCRAPTEYEPDPAESSGPCAVSGWSEWSPCEGCGVRARTRHYVAPRAYKRCHVGFRASTVMSQARPCDAGPCYRPPGELANSSNFNWFYVDNPFSACPASAWGAWSPCSARCGRGRRMRTRMYLSRDFRVQQEISRRLLRDWNLRFAEWQHLDVEYENMTAEDPKVESLVQEQLKRCEFTQAHQEALCDGQRAGPGTNCLNATTAQDVCKLRLNVGPCRGNEERWFFDAARRVCKLFRFSGCGGNANNFRTKHHCRRFCLGSNRTEVAMVAAIQSPNETTTKRVKPTPRSVNNDVMQKDSPIADCEIGPWLGWSSCFGDCHYAVKLNYRLVMRGPVGSDKQCPKLVKSRVCKPAHCHRTFATTEPNNLTHVVLPDV